MLKAKLENAPKPTENIVLVLNRYVLCNENEIFRRRTSLLARQICM